MGTTPDISQIIARRGKRRQRKSSSLLIKLKQIAVGFLVVFSLALVITVIFGAYVYTILVTDLPSIDNLPLLLNQGGQLQTPTRLYDRSGEHVLLILENPNAIQAEYIYYDHIPQNVLDATLAASDPNFWDHIGFETGEGSSSLAVSLVSDLMLWQEPENWRTTWRENLLAAQATKLYGRERILEWYLNSTDYGYLAHGVDQAAWVYFGKSVRDVTLAEAAMLAAIAEAPSLNPIDAPQIAIERQGDVLQAMLAQGYLTAEEANNANLAPIHLQPAAAFPQTMAPNFIDLAMTQLDSQIGKDRILRGGLQIMTTLDYDLQTQVTCSTQIQLARISGELPIDTLGGADCTGATLLPRLRSAHLLPDAELEAGVVVFDSSTGQILALTGNPTAPHQPGTILTPFIYLIGFTSGLNPASLVWDIPASLPLSLEGYGNLDGEFHGPVRIRTALANDYLVPALSTLAQVGASKIWEAAQRSGLNSLTIPQGEGTYNVILNQGEVNLMETTYAYTMFSNQGILSGRNLENEEVSHPAALLTVQDYDGRIWLDWTEPQSRSIVSAQLAYLITDVLSDEISRRESLGHPNPLETGLPTAAKIGQTLSGENVWTIGYTPQRTVGVWIGFKVQNGGSVGEPQQISPLAAAGLWNAVLKTAQQDLDVQLFHEPIGINRITVCDPSGLLPTKDCPKTVTEVFIQGKEPVQTDNLYRSFLINSRTERLATVYTPHEFVEERVYMVMPPEALEWAEAAGEDIPPDTYDVIFNPDTDDEHISILSPEIFSYISGKVSISGRAWGEEFAFYRVQIGEGLNPRQWLQLGQDSSEPVEEGALVDWDTIGLDGLYAIQLQVVNQDQTVESTTIQVTVDNQPPVIQITHPSEGQTFPYPEERAITFQAQVTDNLGIAKVEFFIDDDPLSSLIDPPYAAPWTGSTGEHFLTVLATDLAGNQSEVTVWFKLER